MSFLIYFLRTTYVLVLALLVVVLAKPGDSQGQFRGNNMPGAPLNLPAPAANFGAVGIGFGVFPGVGFPGFGFNGFGFNGFGGFNGRNGL